MNAVSLTLRAALFLASRGFKVFPCRRGTKLPATTNGFKDATTDEAIIRGWFANDRGYNLAVACGPQPNGINLLAVDIDPLHGGDWTWASLINGHVVPPCPTHTTRSGGTHLFFNASTEQHNTSGRLGQGVDTRGVGGYVLVPPSRVVDAVTGEIGDYRTQRAVMLGRFDVPGEPDFLRVKLNDGAVVFVPAEREADLFDFGDSVADRLRECWAWEAEMPTDGWTFAGRRGDQERWTRPDKSTRDGHSAVLHLPDGPFVVWTTERPPGGRTNIDGSSSFSPWEYLKAYRAGGDDKVTAKLAHEIIARRAVAIDRGNLSGQPGPVPERAVSEAGEIEDTALNLPVGFWEAAPELMQVREAALATMTNPFALLVHTLVRISAQIPVCYILPGVGEASVGTATLDLMGCVVAETGVNKSRTERVARRLFPDPEILVPEHRRQVLMDLPPGSGEGLIDSYFEEVEEEDPSTKKGTRLASRRVHHGVHMSVPEGNAFAKVAQRQGVTIVETMNAAWSGETLGQTNVRRDGRRRLIPAGQVRFACVMNIQSSNAWKLFDENMTQVGFPGRLLFAEAADPDARRGAGSWSGPLEWTPLKSYDPLLSPQILTYDEAVTEEVAERMLAISQGRGDQGRRSQHLVLACKVGGILGMWLDRRPHISEAMWALSGQIVGAASGVLGGLEALHLTQTRDRRHRTAEARGEDLAITESARDRRSITEYKSRVLRALRAGPQPFGTDNGLGKMTSGKRRWMVRDAVDELTVEGLIVKDGDRFRLT